MRVLIVVASRHGSTRSIAARLSHQLGLRRHFAEIEDVSDHHHAHPVDTAAFDAAVIGSAVYEGHWLREARRYLFQNAVELQQLPVWLFSSGPVGNDEVGIDPHHVEELRTAVDARDHHLFAGRLDRDELGRVERWIVDVVHAHEGDYRDWSDIDAWADSIADALDRLAEVAADT
jgi:menaquinone-dependent protoporphyrinogen oxidase